MGTRFVSFLVLGAFFLGGLVGDEGCGGIVCMTLSWSTMKDSLGEVRCGCLLCARGDKGGLGRDTMADDFVFCQAALEGKGSGLDGSPDCEDGIEDDGNVAAIMS